MTTNSAYFVARSALSYMEIMKFFIDDERIWNAFEFWYYHHGLARAFFAPPTMHYCAFVSAQHMMIRHLLR